MTAPRRTNLFAQYQERGADLHGHLPGALELLSRQVRSHDPMKPVDTWTEWLDQAALVRDVREQLDALVAALAISSERIALSDRAAGEALGIDGKKVRALIRQAESEGQQLVDGDPT